MCWKLTVMRADCFLPVTRLAHSTSAHLHMCAHNGFWSALTLWSQVRHAAWLPLFKTDIVQIEQVYWALGLGSIYFFIPSYLPDISAGYKVHDGIHKIFFF